MATQVMNCYLSTLIQAVERVNYLSTTNTVKYISNSNTQQSDQECTITVCDLCLN